MKILEFFHFCGSYLPTWIRIQRLNLMRIHADPDTDPKPWVFLLLDFLRSILSGVALTLLRQQQTSFPPLRPSKSVLDPYVLTQLSGIISHPFFVDHLNYTHSIATRTLVQLMPFLASV
jgi:hypothetical protein